MSQCVNYYSLVIFCVPFLNNHINLQRLTNVSLKIRFKCVFQKMQQQMWNSIFSPLVVLIQLDRASLERKNIFGNISIQTRFTQKILQNHNLVTPAVYLPVGTHKLSFAKGQTTCHSFCLPSWGRWGEETAVYCQQRHHISNPLWSFREGNNLW